MLRFSGKVVIVTGSSNGIGRAIAILFAREGAKVTITGRNIKRLEETKQMIVKNGIPEENVLEIVTDITSEEGQNKLINSTIQKFGRLDILVNNAGTGFLDAEGKTGVDQNISDLDKSINLNTRSIVTLTQKAKIHLIEAKGEIVNVSSKAAGPQASPDFIYYGMAKAALDQFTRSSAIDLIRHGVRVNSVSPGLVRTGFGETIGMSDDAFEKMVESMESNKAYIPCGKAGQPEDIANLIAFLADRRLSSYIIGQTIAIDGGTSLIMGMQAFDMTDVLKF
ncbi:hypothetical protein GCK72_019202 [Caenorhabditis remanei]|uniref:Uncharacterized protein n=1 Tax=Caenorhabditis remanei TaxID=31234 RepID=A0A6A5GBN1_CAERE|nr:hypothetical protein GCK72_019202 [Caenorhabditis remanei]KAF1752647.1 hypothetical protein GCK72_019202 [Caenorhabditis remanei]